MPNFLLIAMLIFLLGSSVKNFGQFRIRERVVPLRTTRTQVEKMFKTVKSIGILGRYETEEGNVDVYYSVGGCNRAAWDVPADRVLHFNLYPNKPVSLQTVLSPLKKYFRSVDDIMMKYYLDPAEGTVFAIRDGDENIDYVGFFPSDGDQDLRCKGFPPYSMIGSSFTPYQTLKVKNPRTWDSGLIYETLVLVRDNPGRKALIYVYCKRGGESQFITVKKMIELELRAHLGPKKDRVTIMKGGYRDELEIETFAIRPGDPPISPTPSYPGMF